MQAVYEMAKAKAEHSEMQGHLSKVGLMKEQLEGWQACVQGVIYV